MAEYRVAVLIDGGFLRVQARKAKKLFNAEWIERFAHACAAADESVFRILYYDCPRFSGTVKLPVSGANFTFASKSQWLERLEQKEQFAIRRGVLKFRGFRPKVTPVTPATLTDADFEPVFEQKGVDMRIGLDIAAYSHGHAIHRIVLVTADTDCVPALKYARRAGLQTVLVEPAGAHVPPELTAHADYKRTVALP